TAPGTGCHVLVGRPAEHHDRREPPPSAGPRDFQSFTCRQRHQYSNTAPSMPWHWPCPRAVREPVMRERACIYCRKSFRAAMLTAEPVLPVGLGGRLALKRAACADCATRIRNVTDDFLSTRFALTAAAMTSKRGRRPTDAPPADVAPEAWRRAHRAAAKILYCYLLLELGQSILSSPPSEQLRRHVMEDGLAPWPPRWEVGRADHSPSTAWHV